MNADRPDRYAGDELARLRSHVQDDLAFLDEEAVVEVAYVVARLIEARRIDPAVDRPVDRRT